jgi:hypothetical protein
MSEQKQGGDTSTKETDPTKLTQEAVDRLERALKEFFGEKFAGLEAVVNVKIEQVAATVAGLEKSHDRVFVERDRRYTERFDSAEEAMATALQASREASAVAISAQERAVSAAFDAADRAVMKAESSIEKRADATYVALGELTQMLSALMPRAEGEQRFGDLLERAQSNSTRITQLESQKVGAREDRTGLYATLGAVGGLVFLVMGVLAFLAARGG